MDRNVTMAYGIAGLSLAVAVVAVALSGGDAPAAPPVAAAPRVDNVAAARAADPGGQNAAVAEGAAPVLYVDENGRPLRDGELSTPRGRGDDEGDDDDDEGEGDDDDRYERRERHERRERDHDDD